MKALFILALALIPITLVVGAQAPAQLKPPKQIIEEYFSIEADGGRLTREGWYKSSLFFIKPSKPPEDKKITVIYKNYEVWEPVIKNNTAEVTVGFLPQGQIDSNLRFTPSQSYKGGVRYRLLLTDKHWELGSEGAPLKEVTGPANWRIEGPESMMWITIDTAIRYVAQLRDRTDTLIMRKNADETIAKLKSLR